MTNKWTPDAIKSAMQLYDGGATLAEIGRKYGVTSERARQVIRRAIRQKKKRIALAAELERARFLALPIREVRATVREMAEATAIDWNTETVFGACIARYYLEDIAPA